MAKVTVYVDNEVWNKFRTSVFNKHRTLRMLSREVEISLKSTMVDEAVEQYLSKLRSHLSVTTRKRPVLKGPPAQAVIRKMRRRRFESISGQ